MVHYQKISRVEVKIIHPIRIAWRTSYLFIEQLLGKTGKVAVAIFTLPSTLPHDYILTFTLYL